MKWKVLWFYQSFYHIINAKDAAGLKMHTCAGLLHFGSPSLRPSATPRGL